jgi:Nucleotidyl transferase AbiEii toxin, Type IV TA system
VSAPLPQPDWLQLFRIACDLIRQANLPDDWTFGGGIAMMLRIEHRESHDVDIFLSDPQLLGLLDLQKNDFAFEIAPLEYKGDGARFLKLAFDAGEIDFIVASSLTSSPATTETVEGEVVQLETIPEIITKKIYHRGSSMMPRDIFDVAAAGEQHEDAIITELRAYPNEVARALAGLDKLSPKFVRAAIAELAIKDQYRALAQTALDRTKEILRAV